TGAAASEVAARGRATLAAASARIEYRQDWQLSRTEPSKDPGPFRRLVGHAVSALRERVLPGVEFGHLAGTGFVEPAAGRYLVDYGSYAVIGSDGKVVGGKSGRSVDSLRYGGTPERPGGALWMLRHLAAAVQARPEGVEEVRGAPCRRYAVRTDPTPAPPPTLWGAA